MNKLNVSVIGVGHLGAIHCKLLANNQAINFVGVYDENNERKKLIAEQFNVISFENYSNAITNSDAIIISVPTNFHKYFAEKTILEQKHCFIEKPVCSNLNEAKSLFELSNKYPQIKIQIGHIERFNPAMLSAKKYDLNPLFIEAHRLSQFKPRSTDVSVVYDLMIHDIDLVLLLSDSKPTKIFANGIAVITDSIDVANARIEFENGLVANLTASRISTISMRKFRIFQNKSYFSLDLAKGQLEAFKMVDTDSKNDEEKDIVSTKILGELPIFEDKKIVYEVSEVSSINAMAEEQQFFFDSIIEDKDTGCSLYEGIKALEVAESINDMIEKKSATYKNT